MHFSRVRAAPVAPKYRGFQDNRTARIVDYAFGLTHLGKKPANPFWISLNYPYDWIFFRFDTKRYSAGSRIG